MNPLPGPIPPPNPEVVVDQLPGRQVVRQQTPGTSGAQHIPDGIHHLPAGILGGPATPASPPGPGVPESATRHPSNPWNKLLGSCPKSIACPATLPSVFQTLFKHFLSSLSPYPLHPRMVHVPAPCPERAVALPWPYLANRLANSTILASECLLTSCRCRLTILCGPSMVHHSREPSRGYPETLHHFAYPPATSGTQEFPSVALPQYLVGWSRVGRRFPNAVVPRRKLLQGFALVEPKSSRLGTPPIASLLGGSDSVEA